MDARFQIDEINRWAVIRTAARWEKSVAEHLIQAGVPNYLPLMTRISRSKSKTQSAQLPLFPGYVFCGESEFRNNKSLSWTCKQKIAQLLVAPDPDRMKQELLKIAETLADRQLIQERFLGTIGDTVRIVGGPFTGQHGEIIRLIPGASRIVLEVSFLGVRVEAMIEDRFLEKAQPRKSMGEHLRGGRGHSKAG